MDRSKRKTTSFQKDNSFHNQGHFQSEFSKRMWSSQCLGFKTHHIPVPNTERTLLARRGYMGKLAAFLETATVEMKLFRA